MSYFRTRRNIELSTIYFLETEINAAWTGITTIKSFRDAYKSNLPVVCIKLKPVSNPRLEVGSTTLDSSYSIAIDIFAKSDGQRMDLADFIVDKLKDGWTYYTHSQTAGDPETLTRVSTGYVHVKRFTFDMPVELGDDIDTYDKFRHYIEIEVKKSG